MKASHVYLVLGYWLTGIAYGLASAQYWKALNNYPYLSLWIGVVGILIINLVGRRKEVNS